jgi:mRNA interferase MazF
MNAADQPARGEVWHVRLDGGRAQLVIVLPITRTQRGIPSHVRVQPPEGGLSAVSFIKCEDVRSIAKERLKSKWGTVSAKTLAIVEDHLRILMNL